MTESARLIGVDLHVESRRSLAALLAALPRAQPHDMTSPKRIHLTGAATARATSADALIRRLIATIDALPAPARRCWNEATSRTFDIGIEAGPAHAEGDGCRAFEDVRLEPRTVRAVARVNGRVLVTVYPHTREAVHGGVDIPSRR